MMIYDDHGSGVPLVLIHGFPLCRKMWRLQTGALASAGYRVICPDLPGFGESPALPLTSMNTYADAVIDLLETLGIEKAVIGGMSMGGYVLLNLAERYPDKLLGAMFLVTRAAADDQIGKEKRTMLADEVKAGNRMIVPETFAQVLFAPETPKEKPEVVSEVRQWMEATSAEGLVGGLLAMRDRDDYLERLWNIQTPSLVVGAEQDLAVPLEHSKVLADRLPNSEFKVIPGAGHMANFEQPEQFNKAIMDFLMTLGG